MCRSVCGGAPSIGAGDATQHECDLSSNSDLAMNTLGGGNDALPVEIAICEPIMRFLQLLCENHNKKLQVFCLFIYDFYEHLSI
jgi:hypothetical protein